MTRMLALVVLGALAVSTAQADIGPPKGLKRITVESKILTEKDFPDYQFFAISGGDKATALKLDSKTPATIIPGGGRYRSANLVAVPKGAEKKFTSEKDFLDAVAKSKVDGMVKAKEFFEAFTTVKDTDTRKVLVKEYVISKIDAKDGIVLVAKKEEGKGSEEESDSVALAPRGGMWIAGLCAAMAVMLGGVWFSRRARSSQTDRA